MLKIFSVLFIVALGILLLAVQPYPVLHDYPEWMYQGHITYSLLAGANPSIIQLFEWVPAPVPNAISQIGIGGLNFLVSPVAAGQIWLGLYLLLAVVTGYLVSRAREYSGSVFCLFTVTIAFGPGFWNGYLNFQFGVLLFALFVATGLRRNLVWVFLFSVLIYFSHAAVFAGFVIYVVLAEINDQRSAGLRLRWQGIALSLIPALALLLWYTITRFTEDSNLNVGVGSLSQWVQYKLYTLAKQGPFHNFILPAGESLMASADALYKMGFAVNFVIAVLIGLWFLHIAWGMVSGRSLIAGNGKPQTAVLLTVLVLLLVWLLAGKNTLGVVNLGERFLIVALMLLLTCIQCPRWIRKAWVFLCAIVSLGILVSLLLLTPYSDKSYAVDRSADTTELESYVDDIYRNSRHKYFNHRVFIYANLGQYLSDPDSFDQPPLFDHESSIVRLRKE